MILQLTISLPQVLHEICLKISPKILNIKEKINEEKIFKLNREKIKILLESIFEEVSRQSFMSFTMNTSLLSV